MRVLIREGLRLGIELNFCINIVQTEDVNNKQVSADIIVFI